VTRSRVRASYSRSTAYREALSAARSTSCEMKDFVAIAGRRTFVKPQP
jgi:hypothetical protein